VTASSDQPSAVSQKAIIFDLDGVLIDSERLQYKAYSTVLASFGVHVTEAEYAAHWITAGHGAEYAVTTYELPVDAAELRRLKNPVYHEMLRQDPVLMPGADAALARLGAHCALALATNSNRQDVGFVLDYFDLRRSFAVVVTREDYDLAKPNPDAYLRAAARLGVAPPSCVVVEDSYRGILAAHRAGAVALAIPNTFTLGSDFSLAATVLHSLDELTLDLVENLLSAHA
jgi:HAD superfamily hydrolase (TIGR01509 family)